MVDDDHTHITAQTLYNNDGPLAPALFDAAMAVDGMSTRLGRCPKRVARFEALDMAPFGDSFGLSVASHHGSTTCSSSSLLAKSCLASSPDGSFSVRRNLSRSSAVSVPHISS